MAHREVSRLFKRALINTPKNVLISVLIIVSVRPDYSQVCINMYTQKSILTIAFLGVHNRTQKSILIGGVSSLHESIYENPCYYYKRVTGLTDLNHMIIDIPNKISGPACKYIVHAYGTHTHHPLKE